MTTYISIFRPTKDEVLEDYILINKEPGEKGRKCSSNVGNVNFQPEMNLSEGCFKQSTIIHEFVHAWGFHHEQARSDRD